RTIVDSIAYAPVTARCAPEVVGGGALVLAERVLKSGEARWKTIVIIATERFMVPAAPWIGAGHALEDRLPAIDSIAPDIVLIIVCVTAGLVACSRLVSDNVHFFLNVT